MPGLAISRCLGDGWNPIFIQEVQRWIHTGLCWVLDGFTAVLRLACPSEGLRGWYPLLISWRRTSGLSCQALPGVSRLPWVCIASFTLDQALFSSRVRVAGGGQEDYDCKGSGDGGHGVYFHPGQVQSGATQNSMRCPRTVPGRMRGVKMAGWYLEGGRSMQRLTRKLQIGSTLKSAQNRHHCCPSWARTSAELLA